MMPIAIELNMRSALADRAHSGRCRVATRHAPFGYSSHGQSLLVHRAEVVAVGWSRAGEPFVGARWLCRAHTLTAVLTFSEDVEEHIPCSQCRDIDENGGIRGRRVYFAERDGRIKIGVSSNVGQRMHTLGATLLASVPGGVVAERALHRHFADSRIAGEWFRPSSELLAHIDAIVGAATSSEEVG